MDGAAKGSADSKVAVGVGLGVGLLTILLVILALLGLAVCWWCCWRKNRRSYEVVSYSLSFSVQSQFTEQWGKAPAPAF